MPPPERPGEVPVPVRIDPIASYRIPKRSGGIRRMALLSERDAERWHQLSGRFGIALERRLPGAVLANRVRVTRTGRQLRPVGTALEAARRASALLARDARLLLRADVASFYPSVTPPVVAAAIVEAGGEPEDARLAATMLEGWGTEGYPGLPIGPPGSAIVANAVLRPVDRALAGRSVLRWVDDYLIACTDERDAARALDRLDEALGRLGLRRNAAKTRVEEPRRSFRWLGEVSGRGGVRR